MPDEIGKLTAVFEADTSDLEAGIARTDSGLTGLAGRVGDALTSAGSAFMGMGRGILMTAAPMVAGLALVANSALGFGTQMTDIQAVTNETDDEMSGLSETILDVDSTFSNVELASTFYDIAGSVTDASQRIPIFNAAIATAQAGNADLGVTTAALTSILNSYGSEAITASEASDLMTRMVGMGVGSMGEFASALPGVIGLASSTGVSFDEIASSMAFLTTKGNTPADAVTQLSAAMVSLLNPNETMKAALEELGVANGEALIQMYGLGGALSMVSDTSVVAEEGLAKTLGSVEALRATTSMTADSTEDLQVKMGNFEINLPLTDLQKFNQGFREGVDNATAMAEAIQMGDTAAQIGLVSAEFDDLKVIMGNALLPVIFDVTQEVKPMVKAFASFAKENPRLIRTVAMVVVGLVGLGTAFVVLGGILSAAGTVFAAVGGALAFILSPIGLAVVGIVALGAAVAFLVSNNIFGLGDAFRSLTAGLQDGLGIILNFGQGLLNAFQSGGISAAVEYFKGAFVGALSQVGAIALAKGIEIASSISNGLATGLPRITETVKNVAPVAAAAFADAMISQGPTIQRGAAQFGAAVEQESPKVAKQGGLMAGMLTGDFLIGMITYGPQILTAMAIVGYYVVAGIASFGANVVGLALDVGIAFMGAFGLGMIMKLPGIWAALEGQFNTLIGDPVKNWFDQMGQDAAEGWKTGFGLKGIPDWLKDQFQIMVDKVKNLLGIHSPSKVFTEIGVALGQGFIDGVSSILGGLSSAAQLMYNAVAGPLNAMISLASQAASAVGSSSTVGNAISGAIGSPIGGTDQREVPMPPGLQLPGRAMGGSVDKNIPYIVGEERPELFVPSTSGRIIPNLDMLTTPQGRNEASTSNVTQFSGPFIFNGVQDVEGIMSELSKLAKQKHRNPLVVGNY